MDDHLPADEVSVQKCEPEAPSGEESEEVISRWADSRDIEFRLPVYSSDTCLRFPQELIERICEHLWNDPFALFSCELACCAWYHAAQRVLSTILHLSTREALHDYALMLMSRRNVPYRKAFKHMDIHDSASKPFAQTWPMLIPGCMLPQMLHLQLYDLDWTTTIKPHDTFFIHLSSYTSIKYLTLHHCRFHGATDLRRMISALPNLQFLSLLEVTLQHSLMPDLARPRYLTTHHRTLESIQIIAATHSTFSDICGPEHMDIVFRNMLHLIAWYSSITSLVIDLQFFPSLLHLEEYLLHYPCLSSLGVSGDYGSSLDSESAPEDVVPTHAEKSRILSLSHFSLHNVPEQAAVQLLNLFSIPQPCSQLRKLEINLAGRWKTAEIPACTSRVLRLCGRGLEEFHWQCGKAFGLAPSLANNTSLRRLSMLFDEVIPSSQGIQRILSSMLSDITSIHLQHLICFILIANRDMLPQSDETPLAVTDSIDSISTFHAILSSTTFDGLPVCTSNTGVHIHFHMEEIWDKPAMMSALKTHMIALFAPWLDRRIVELQFVSGGTSWQLVRTVPTSDPRTRRAIMVSRTLKKTGSENQ